MPDGGVWATPRPIPSRRLPALAGTAVVVLALPVFLVAGLPMAAWGISAGLWIAYQAIGLLLERAALGMDNLALAGVVAFGRITRAAVMAWQRTQGLPATGYLTDAQLTSLRQQAATAGARFDQAWRQDPFENN